MNGFDGEAMEVYVIEIEMWDGRGWVRRIGGVFADIQKAEEICAYMNHENDDEIWRVRKRLADKNVSPLDAHAEALNE